MLSLILTLAGLGTPPLAAEDQRLSPEALRVGRWVAVKGELAPSTDLDGPTRFRAQAIEIQVPTEYEGLIGTVAAHPTDPERVMLLGQPVALSEKTEWTRLAPGSDLVGQRVRIDGRYRGPGKFSARDVRPWGEGRDRLVGRVDAVVAVEGGLELEVMHCAVFVPTSAEIASESQLDELPLIPRRWKPAQLTGRIDEDDLLRERVVLAPNLRLGGQLEFETQGEDEFDLDEGDDEDRTDTEAVARLRLAWRPADDLFVRAEGRLRQRWRDDDEDGYSTAGQVRMGETWLYWRDGLGTGWDLQVGRQDFDDPREWIYDQNLDGARVFHTGRATRLELAAATSWGGDAGRRDRDALNLFGYLSNLDQDRHLAAWAAHRSYEDGSGDRLTHLGLRALGEWLPDSEAWLELGAVIGDEAGRDVTGYGFDIGATWDPESWPVTLSAGYAFGSGDDGSGDDGAFRQTGLQDNNGKLGTVTSIRYYGELLDPELSNLAIGTVGLSWWLEERTSLSLIAHSYRQVEAAPFIRDSELDIKPDGVDADLGQELDLVLGSRRWRDLDLELVAGLFLPGDAFPDDAEDARFVRFQLRYRF